MNFENILFTVEQNIATIQLNRPEALNAVDLTTAVEVASILEQCSANRGIRFVSPCPDGGGGVAGPPVRAGGNVRPGRSVGGGPGRRGLPGGTVEPRGCRGPAGIHPWPSPAGGPAGHTAGGYGLPGGLLRRVGEFMLAHPWIREIDLNPVAVYPSGLALLDVRVAGTGTGDPVL